MSAVCSSRLPVGSSARTSGGLLASARATATRCCSPPDSLEGRWSRRSRGRARRATAARARRAACGVGAADQLGQNHVLGRAELRQQMVELVDEAERSRRRRVRPSSSSSAASSPAIRIEPSNPPSSKPTAWSRVDLPEPEGPSRATISPGATEIDAAQHLDGDAGLGEAALEARGYEHRLTHSAAPAPDRCSPPSRPDRASRGSYRISASDDDRGDLDRVGLGRKLGEEADRRIPQILAGHRLDAVDHSLAEEEEDRAEDQPSDDAERRRWSRRRS